MENCYNQVPFTSFPSPDRHPQRLAVLGELFGLPKKQFGSGRILDLGCSDGSNLIAIAIAYPNMTCVGVDIATQQIATGKEAIKALNLSNLELLDMDLANLTANFEPFDYVICHGVFSWISEQEQDRLLSTIKKVLAPDGLAYLSYNCMPGWQIRDTLRLLLLEQTASIIDSQVKIETAKELMKWLLETLCDDYSPYAQSLKNELENVKHHSDSYVLHELLNPHASGIHFSDLLQKLTKHQLRFICEARFSRTLYHRLAKEDVSSEKYLSSDSTQKRQLQIESFLSYIYPTALRRSVICHAEQALIEKPNSAKISSFLLASSLLPAATPDLERSIPDEYANPQGFMVEVKDPLFKTALAIMAAAWPQTISFTKLVSELRLSPHRNRSKEEIEQSLIEFLFDFYCKDLIELYTTALPFSLSVTDKPIVSPLARRQLQTQNWSTNLRHEYVVLNELERSLAKLCDGRRTRSEIASALHQEMIGGRLEVVVSGRKITDSAEQATLINQSLSDTLQELAQKALII